MTRRRRSESGRTNDERLDLFQEAARDVCTRRAIVDGTVRADFNYTALPGGGGSWEFDNGDEEDARSLMLAFRKFVAQGDTNFYRIANLLQPALTDQELVARNLWHREMWKQSLKGSHCMESNGEKYDCQGFFNVIANGVLFHDDAELLAVWSSWDPFDRTWAMNAVHSMILNCAHVLELEVLLIRAAREWQALDWSRSRATSG